MVKRKRKIYLYLIFAIICIALVVLTLILPQQNKAGGNINNVSIISTSIPVSTTVTTTAVVTSIAPTTIPTTTATMPVSADKWVYFPLDKTTAIGADYYPNDLVSVSSYGISSDNSGNSVRKIIIPDLINLYGAAKKDGINLKVISAYRSYQNQVTTFNYWKSTEKAKGLSDADAEKAANVYSAYPGHSEHQLGTTMDIVSSSDSGFDFTATNTKVWAWMKDNISKYGFVLSYPENKVDKTGYTYEPWHIRWTGYYIAQDIVKTDYLNPNNSNTSTSYFRGVWKEFNK